MACMWHTAVLPDHLDATTGAHLDRPTSAAHKRHLRPRVPAVVSPLRRKEAISRAHDRLACEVCGFDFAITYGDLGTGFIEAHHVLPLSAIPEVLRVTPL